MLAIVTALLLLGCVGSCVIATGRLNDAKAQLAAKEREVEDSQQIASRLADAEAEFRSTAEQLGTLEKAVSTRAYVPTLLGQLEDLAAQTHLQVITVRPDENPVTPPTAKKPEEGADSSKEGGDASAGGKSGTAGQKAEPPKPYTSLPINIQVAGKYWDVMSFLYKVTTFPKILAVGSVTVEPSAPAETPGSPKLLAKLKVTAFIFKDDSTGRLIPPPQPSSAAAPAGKPNPEAKV
jgi:Tfp pilus assembly protein PilO